jgi:hypothetical protein
LSPLPRILISLKVYLHTLLFYLNSCLYKSVIPLLKNAKHLPVKKTTNPIPICQ